MAEIKFSVALPGIATVESNTFTYIPHRPIVLYPLTKGENIIGSLPKGIANIYDPNLGVFPLWRFKTTSRTDKTTYYNGERFDGITLKEVSGGVSARAVSATKWDDYDNVSDYLGSAALLLNNISEVNAGNGREQLGSLITFVPATWKLEDDVVGGNPYQYFAVSNLNRPTEVGGSAKIIPADVRDAMYEQANPAVTALGVYDVAFFMRVPNAWITADSGNWYFNNDVITGSSLSTGRVLTAAKTDLSQQPYNIMAMKTTGASKVNTFPADAPYPRIINVQTLAANRSGYSITGYTLSVAADLGIDLTDDKKYMFLTNIADDTTMSGIYIGDESCVEVSRTANTVVFDGVFNAPLSGTQYMWIAIIQMYE